MEKFGLCATFEYSLSKTFVFLTSKELRDEVKAILTKADANNRGSHDHGGVRYDDWKVPKKPGEMWCREVKNSGTWSNDRGENAPVCETLKQALEALARRRTCVACSAKIGKKPHIVCEVQAC